MLSEGSTELQGNSPRLCSVTVMLARATEGNPGTWATRLAEARVPAARPPCVCLTPSPWAVKKTGDSARVVVLNTRKTQNTPETYFVLYPFGFYQTERAAVPATSLSALFWDQDATGSLNPLSSPCPHLHWLGQPWLPCSPRTQTGVPDGAVQAESHTCLPTTVVPRGQDRVLFLSMLSSSGPAPG